MDTLRIGRFFQQLLGRGETPPKAQALRATPLEDYWLEVQNIILVRQDWLTGLLPASTAITHHGNYTDAWVRDNIYSILAPWGLSIALRKQRDTEGRAYELEQRVVKLMRGLLIAMMRQSAKVERFKHTQDPLDALHAKYDTKTGESVVGDEAWGHLQIDATSLYLLMLAQMTASGLRIIFTIDEVNFIQNLVHYIARAYRTPDYGIWERGHKLNHGEAELNASSIGMAKAALEAMSGFNLFGKGGGQAAIIHVISDDIARTRITLNALLPRESISKEVDAALLSIAGYPAFSIDDPLVLEQTLEKIKARLEGPYGYKRFLLDGHQTVIEDPNRLHYESHELKAFAHIECEWPLFLTYQLLGSLFRGQHEEADRVLSKLEALTIERHGQKLLPELYRVPFESIEAERQNPGSQARVPNENIPLVWAQSLYILGSLMHDGWLTAEDIDPLNRHRSRRSHSLVTVQVALLAETQSIQESLLQHGIPSQTRMDIAPLEVRDARELSLAYRQIGRNDQMGLSGRPYRQLRTLATSKAYLLAGVPVMFIPQFINQKGFYLALDNTLLIERLKTELTYISQHWDSASKPLLVIDVHPNMIAGPDGEVLLAFLQRLVKGEASDTPVRVCRLSEFSEDTALERIAFLHNFQLGAEQFGPENPEELDLDDRIRAHDGAYNGPLIAHEMAADDVLIQLFETSSNAAEQLDLLTILVNRHGLDYPLKLTSSERRSTLTVHLESLYQWASNHHDWRLLRLIAALLGKYDIDLEQAVTEILVRQHALTVGKSYSGKATIVKPMDSSDILNAIRAYNPDQLSLQVLIQELIIAIGLLIKQDSSLFKDMNTIRVGQILDFIIAAEKHRDGAEWDHSFDKLMRLAPHHLAEKLRETLRDVRLSQHQLGAVESLHAEKDQGSLALIRSPLEGQPPIEPPKTPIDWSLWREQQGSFGREGEAFFEGVWHILHHSHGLMIGDKYNSQGRIDSQELLSHMTVGEKTFRLYVTHVLNKIESPIYRQLTVETLMTLAAIFKDHKDFRINDTLVIDILIGHAVRIEWLTLNPLQEAHYGQHVAAAWEHLYQLDPGALANAIVRALNYLMTHDHRL